MIKVFIYKMNAGMCGTGETFYVVGDKPLTHIEEDGIVCEHASSYQDQNEDGEWEEADPEIYLHTTLTTLEALKEEADYYGEDTFEALVERIEEEGMVWQSSP